MIPGCSDYNDSFSRENVNSVFDCLMRSINIPSRVNHGFGSGLSIFLSVLEQIESIPEGEAVQLDMGRCEFLNPFLLLPLMLLVEAEKRKGREITVQSAGQSSYFRDYLNLIAFAGGLRPEDIAGGAYTEALGKYEKKTYIPIISFPATRSQTDTSIRDNFLGIINTLLAKQLGLKGPLLIAVMYLIDEAVNNIVDHSREERGYIFAQYYPSRRYMDLCVADKGIGLLGTYMENRKQGIINHVDALKSAAAGESTKNLPGYDGRGFGIRTSKEMLAKGLDGKYFLFSGNAFLLKTNDNEAITGMPETLSWKGTIVALRIPYYGKTGFNPADFYEN